MGQTDKALQQLQQWVDRKRDAAVRNALASAYIVHGRYDLICPMESAWELHQAWPKSELKIVPDAGHSAMETGICSALVDATDWFADQLG